MSKYHSILNKIQQNLKTPVPSSPLTLNAHEWELIEEALITLRFLELIFKKRSLAL